MFELKISMFNNTIKIWFKKLLYYNCLLALVLMSSCSHDYTPKPRGYFRIDLPQKKYHLFSPANCPFEFEIPDYATAIEDTRAQAQLCWYDIYFKQFDAKINLTYLPIENNLNTHLENCRTLAYKHSAKADGIDEFYIQSENGKATGIMFSIAGNAASNLQFYVTDSTQHFLRGALYFNCVPQSDSLAPVISFCEKDIDHLVKTLRWK